jgi:hypothetical protein
MESPYIPNAAALSNKLCWCKIIPNFIIHLESPKQKNAAHPTSTHTSIPAPPGIEKGGVLPETKKPPRLVGGFSEKIGSMFS